MSIRVPVTLIGTVGLALVLTAAAADVSSDRLTLKAMAFESVSASVTGATARPFESTDARLFVLIFISNDCPICNRYAPEIRRLEAEYRSRGVALWLVHPLEDETREAILRHAEEYDLPRRVLRDPSRILTRLGGITVTPEALVLDRDLKVLYRGRIDDRFPELGRQRAEPTRRDLREALDAALAGKPVPHPRTQAIGCILPALRAP